jgi:hypothetical protein
MIRTPYNAAVSANVGRVGYSIRGCDGPRIISVRSTAFDGKPENQKTRKLAQSDLLESRPLTTEVSLVVADTGGHLIPFFLP